MPLLIRLLEDFTLDRLTTLWPNSYGTRSVGAGRARLGCDTGYSAISTAASWTLTGSQVHARLIPPARNGANVSAYIEMMFESPTPGTDVAITISSVSGLITCSSRVAYTDGAAVSQTYDATTHRYVRMREASGTLYWERSSDRASWTVMRSLATPAWVTATVNTGKLTIQAHRDDGTPNVAEADDINMPAPPAGFPQSQLPVSLWLAPGGDPVDPTLRAWTEITGDYRVRSGISIETGRGDEQAEVDASKVALTLDNRAGHYSPRNPLGQWYGTLRRNAPLQLRLTRAVDTFTRSWTNGMGVTTSGHLWTHTQPTDWIVDGSKAVVTFSIANAFSDAILPGGLDVELVYSTVLPVQPATAGWVTAGMLRRVDGDNFYRMHTEINASGQLLVGIQRRLAGVVTILVSNITVGTYTAGQKVWSRCRAEGPYLMVKAWIDGAGEPSTWQATTIDTAILGTEVGIYEWRIAGNTGSTQAYVDDVSVTAILATGTIDQLPVRWDQSGNNCWTPVTASGMLRRLAQGQAALDSPIRRQLEAQPLAAYWPLEDGSDATVASAALPPTQSATTLEVEFGVDDCPPGASSAIKLSNTGQGSYIRGAVRRWNQAQTGFSAMVYFRLPALPGSSQTLMDLGAVGTATRWQIACSATSMQIWGRTSDGSDVVPLTGALYIVDPTKWVAVQLETQEVGGNVEWSLIWHQVGGDFTFWAMSGSYAGTADRLTSAALYAPVAGTMVSHLWLGSQNLPFVDDTFRKVSAGYIGELAGDRVDRLGREAGIPVRSALPAKSAPMGPQKAGAWIDLIRECEVSDGGVLVEQSGLPLYLPRATRYNATNMLPLDMRSGHIAAPPEPTDDDQLVRNDVIVTRTGGGYARAVDETSPMGVPAIGRYDTSLELSLATDDVLEDHAAWRLHLGTVDELRWPVIELDLARNPDLIDVWLRLRVGSRITIANPPSTVSAVPIDLIVEGIQQTLGPFSWRVTLNCSPASPWRVGIYDATTSRYDSASTTLASPGVNATATSWPITTAMSGHHWSTTAVPYRWLVAGELVEVTAMTAVAGGPGAYTQTATVRRAINGVAKAQAAGAQIHLAEPVYYAL